MKVKVNEASGVVLDWMVAKCMNYETLMDRFGLQTMFTARGWKPSTDWAQGGPIIEREKIAVAYEPSMVYDDSCRWKALAAMSDNEHQYGPTPLIAAMRCYVASKLGDEVDVPEELCVQQN